MLAEDPMSYGTRIEELIGKQVAEFQTELTLAKKLQQYLANPSVGYGHPLMPYGYPMAVYHPMHVCHASKAKHLIVYSGGKLSNNVPRVLSMDVIGGYPLGIYNLGAKG